MQHYFQFTSKTDSLVNSLNVIFFARSVMVQLQTCFFETFVVFEQVAFDGSTALACEMSDAPTVFLLDVLCCFVKQWARLPELPAWYQSQYLQAEVLELSLDQPL